MLKYRGNGNFLAGIPARDLSDEEVEKFGEKYLLSTKLYEKQATYKRVNNEIRSKEKWQE
jgi:hypothetical protein